MIPNTQFNGQNVLTAGTSASKAPFLPAMLSKNGKSENESNPSFGEDFIQEHCLSGMSEAWKPEVAGRDMHDCPQAYGFPC